MSKQEKNAWIVTFILFIGMNLILIVWRFWQPSSLIVDQSVVIILVTTILFKVGINKFQKNLLKNLHYKSFVSVLASLMFLVWVLCVPGTVERSRSLHIFRWITYDNTAHSQEQIESALQEAYDSFDLQGFRLRLHEHQVRFLISRDTHNLTLTAMGHFVFWSAKKTAAIYNLQGWDNVALK